MIIDASLLKNLITSVLIRLGGPGSGFKGHAGIPGHRGGSAPRDGSPILSKRSRVGRERRHEIARKGEKVSTKPYTDSLGIDKYVDEELGRYQKGEVKYISLGQKALSAGTLGVIVKNARARLDNYSEALYSDTSALVDRTISRFEQVVAQGLADGSLKGISADALDKMFGRGIDNLIAQEIASRQRQLGDHGIRHICTNADMSLSILDEVAKSGRTVTGKDKLQALQAQLVHDTGYVADSMRETFDNKTHPEVSLAYIKNLPEYKTVFGSDYDKFLEMVRTHDGIALDWENNPVLSAVRTSDNLGLFANQKLPDLFLRVPGAMDQLAKLQLAKVGGEAEKVLPTIQNNLRVLIDKTNLDGRIKEDLYRAVKEVNPGSGKFSLGMIAGELEGFGFANNVLEIKLKQNTNREVLNDLFALGDRQFNKFIEPYDKKGTLSDGLDLSKAGKPVLRLKTREVQTNPAFASVSIASIRPLLSRAMRSLTKNNVKSVFASVRKDLATRTTKGEFLAIRKLIMAGDTEGLSKFPLTERERSLVSAVERLLEALLFRFLSRKERL